MSLDAHNLPLSQWMSRIANRQVVLPRFQRYEAWGNREISDLLLTVLRGLPAGSLLTQHVAGQPLFHWRPLQSAPDKGDHITSLLLDGQQRLTALWRSLNDVYERQTFFLSVPNGDFSLSNIEVRAETVYFKGTTKYPVWSSSQQECWQRRLVPIALLNPLKPGSEVNSWALAATGNDFPQTLELAGHINDFKARIASFNLPFLELPSDTSREVVLDVFVKLNTRSARLTAFDIIVAEVEGLDESLHLLVENLGHRVPALKEYDETPEDLLLSVACLLQDRVPNQTGYFGLDLERMVKDWPEIENGVKQGVKFLQEEHVFDAQRLPTEAPLAPLFALWALAPQQPDKLGNFRLLMRRYLWRAFFSDRYERAAATAALQDFRGLRGMVDETGSESGVPIFDALAHPLPVADALASAGWPRSRQRLPRAILALSLRGSALDVADATPVSREHLKQREYHHLFPVDFLKGQGKGEGEIMRALNCALISWRTNRTISNKAPKDYLEERMRKMATDSIPARDAIAFRLSTHGVDLDSLENDPYNVFLQKRAVWVEKAMCSLCAGNDWK